MSKSKIYHWEYGDMGYEYPQAFDMWYPTDGTFYDEPKRDVEKEKAEWEKIYKETRDLPDIKL